MVEIKYRDSFELADLAGTSVAEARKQYKSEFGIPDKAQVRLNGKLVKRKHEHSTELDGDDRLYFQDKSRRLLLLVGPVLLTLAIVGGIFAYGATTASVTLELTNKPDFANVTASGSLPTWNVFGYYRGVVSAGELFVVAPDNDFTGDMVVVLTIANIHDLVETYRMLVLEIKAYDSAGTPVQVGDTVYLGYPRGEVSIEIDQTGTTAPYTIEITDGFYSTHRAGWTPGKEDPTIICDVLQKGAL